MSDDKTTELVSRLREEYVQQSARCGEEDSQERSLLAQEAANEIERLQMENSEMRRTYGSHPLFQEKDRELERWKQAVSRLRGIANTCLALKPTSGMMRSALEQIGRKL